MIGLMLLVQFLVFLLVLYSFIFMLTRVLFVEELMEAAMFPPAHRALVSAAMQGFKLLVR